MNVKMCLKVFTEFQPTAEKCILSYNKSKLDYFLTENKFKALVMQNRYLKQLHSFC